MHEFATNAAKYGALSTPGGRVAINWSIAGEKLLLVWCEQGGPPCAGAPGDSGFGTHLAGAIVSSQLAGEISRERSEEHTSELQSLMRISYAVFFLNKTLTQ